MLSLNDLRHKDTKNIDCLVTYTLKIYGKRNKI